MLQIGNNTWTILKTTNDAHIQIYNIKTKEKHPTVKIKQNLLVTNEDISLRWNKLLGVRLVDNASLERTFDSPTTNNNIISLSPSVTKQSVLSYAC